MSNYIQKAADILGGQARLARAVGVKPPTVNQWANGDRPVPVGRCPQIEQLTGGSIRCEDLRPDVNWAVLRGKPLSAIRPKPTQPETRA